MVLLHRAVPVAGLLSILIAAAGLAKAQATRDTVAPLLEEQVQPKAVSAYQIQKYLMKRIPKPVVPGTAEEWNVEKRKLRQHILQDIAYHGWPPEWIDSAPQFEQTGVIETRHGYRVRKYRYEIVPGFRSTALLYEPEQLNKRVPAILNLTGHEPLGNLTEYEQKRCINFAKTGNSGAEPWLARFGRARTTRKQPRFRRPTGPGRIKLSRLFLPHRPSRPRLSRDSS